MNRRFYLNIFGILIILFTVFITLYYLRDLRSAYIIYTLSGICFVILAIFSYMDYGFVKGEDEDIDASLLVLLSEEDTVIKSWELMGRNSLIIGKNNDEEDVDIDLSDTLFSGTVSDIHAILNYVDRYWYIEDNQSKNGTHIRGEDNKLYNIKDGQSKLTKQDYIYIGLNKLQIR